MCLVTTLAISCCHVGAMRLMALSTERYFTMCIVAEAAGKRGMLALDLLQLDYLLGMAGETLVGDIIGQFNDFRCMRVIVATDTTGKIVVRLAAVTLTAERDDFFDSRRMAGMTVLATDLRLVGSAIGGYCLWCSSMTLDTISVSQHRFWICRSGCQYRHPHQQCRQCDNFQHS